MTAYRSYVIRPVDHGLNLDAPSMNQAFQYAGWPAQNFKIKKGAFKKRNGYTQIRNLGSNVDIQQIIFFQTRTGNTHTIILTDQNAIKLESDGTWSYINLMHTAGTNAQVQTGTEDTVDGSGTDWVDASDPTVPEAGDFFVLDDDLTSTSEPDANWTEIESVDSDTAITLVDNYSGTLDSAGDYYVRKLYSVPSNERWSYAILNSNLYFSNGNEYVNVWDGTGTATHLDTTDAVKARYLIEYADRLIQADFYDNSGNRQPYSIKWSKNGDPSDWTHANAGEADLLDTSYYIMGMGKVGTDLAIYKTDSITFAYRTGTATSPIGLGKERVGIGCVAPYSIVHALGTNFFIGRSDFYYIDGDRPVPIGKPIRERFYDLVGATEIKRVFGYNNTLEKEIRWFATDGDGERRCFAWNYKNNEWSHSKYAHAMSSGGKGEILAT